MSQNSAWSAIEIKLDKSSAIPLYKQVGDALFFLIESGALKPDTKLPPIRRFAELLGVNNVTIVNAYDYLESKNSVYSLVGSGTYVARHDLPEPEIGRIGQMPLRKTSSAVMHPKNSIDLSKSSTPQSLFPVAEFKRLFNEVLDRDKGGAFSYEESLGYRPLRESIVEYLSRQGISANADRVHIISGAQQGIDIISKALLMPQDVVFTEKPTYTGAAAAFLSRGAKVYSISMRGDGIDIDELSAAVRQVKPKLIYCMPCFQTPTCVSYSLKKKRALVELANKYDFYIAEEDNQSDFSYSSSDITHLKTLDYKNRVIYIKSFSKILMPGLRIGFMVLPRAISEASAAAKHTTDIDTSGFMQRSFHLFMQSGMIYDHISAMRSLFEAKYKHVLEILKPLEKFKVFEKPGGGLNLWLKTPQKLEPADFYDKLENSGVIVSRGSDYCIDGEDIPYYKISFADVDKNDMDTAAEIIKGFYQV